MPTTGKLTVLQGNGQVPEPRFLEPVWAAALVDLPCPGADRPPGDVPRPRAEPSVSLVPQAWYRLHALVREGAKFLTVGGAGYIVDVGVFNALLYAGGEGPLYDRPLTGKTISVVVATLVTYAGNRFWTFRHRGRSGYAREYALFFVLNAVGLAIALSCLAFSRYVLELSGPIADNIAANVVGLALATTFRFWSYRRWVFPAVLTAVEEEDEQHAVRPG